MIRRLIGSALLVTLAGAAALLATAGSTGKKPYPGLAMLAKVNHIVVIYEENHSFDNLYGGWEGVNGLRERRGQAGEPVGHAVQLPAAAGREPDRRRRSPATCTDTTSTATTFTSHFTNPPFTIDSFIPPTATTCPKPGVFAATAS